MPVNADAAVLTVTCEPGHYSASAIAHAVEDADAHLLNLNVTADRTDIPGAPVIELRVSHRNTDAVARSLARYGYTVLSADGDSALHPADRPNPYAALIRYLDI